jgi:hypothetical protein
MPCASAAAVENAGQELLSLLRFRDPALLPNRELTSITSLFIAVEVSQLCTCRFPTPTTSPTKLEVIIEASKRSLDPR